MDYIIKETEIETIKSEKYTYHINKVITKDGAGRYVARAQMGEWKFSTTLYDTYEECKQEVRKHVEYDKMQRITGPIPPAVEVSADNFPIESDLESGVYWLGEN